MRNINLPLDKLANGELDKEIDRELKKVFDNIHDEKTDPTQERGITIKVKFIPCKERENIEIESEISTKLAKINGTKARAITRRNPNTGQIEVMEVKNGIPGQTYFNDNTELMTEDGRPITN